MWKMDYKLTMNEPCDTESRDGLAKRGTAPWVSFLEVQSSSRGSNASFGQTSTDELDSVPGAML